MDGVEAWGRIVFVGPSGAELATWVLGGAGPPDLAVVGALARWQLMARRAGGSIRLLDASRPLAELLELVGLLGEVGG